jgi:hypothetical protein
MKNFFFTLAFVFVAQFILAQVPQQVNFQAVIRDNAGQILTDTDVSLKFSILQNNMVVSEEIDTVHTTPFGIANTLIGDNSTTFAAIDWFANPVEIKLEFSQGGSPFEAVGLPKETSSVFYAIASKNALHAQNAGHALVADTVLNLSVSTGQIVDGTILPEDLSPILLEKQWKQDTFGNIYRDTLRVSIGTNQANGLLTVQSDENFGHLIHSEYSGNDFSDVVAVSGYSAPQNNYGIGGQFTGGYYGVRAYGSPGGEAALYASSNGASKAGVFQGDVTISGNGSFSDGINISGSNSTVCNINGNARINGTTLMNGHAEIFSSTNNIGFYEPGSGSTFGFKFSNQIGNLKYNLTDMGIRNFTFGTTYNLPFFEPWYNWDSGSTLLGTPGYRWFEVYVGPNGINQAALAPPPTENNNFPYGLSEVLKLNPVESNISGNKVPNKNVLGFVGKEIEAIIPEAVTKNEITENELIELKKSGKPEPIELDSYGINYSSFTPVLVRAIQEQQMMIEQLQKQMLEMQAKIEQLEKH